MRSLARLVFDLLPFAAEERRVVDETCADWRHEVQAATSLGARMRAHVLGVTSMVGVLARVLVGGLGSSAAWLGLGRTAAIALPMAALMIFQTYRAEYRYPAAMLLLLLPQALAVTVPLAALLLAAVPMGRSVAGPAVLVTALAAANLAWVIPEANQGFRQRAIQWHHAQIGQVFPGEVARGPAELTLSQLIDAVQGEKPAARQALAQLSFRTALVVIVPVCLVLGMQVRRWRVAAGRARWVPYLLLAGSVPGAWGLGGALGSWTSRVLHAYTPFETLTPGLEPWPQIVLLVVLGLAFAGRSRHLESTRLGDPARDSRSAII